MRENKYKIHKAGNWRGEKIKYKDGIGCCIWIPFKKEKNEEEEQVGLCFDFSADEIPDLKKIINILEKAKEDIFTPDPKEIEFEEKWKIKESKWHYKVLNWLSDLSISFTPFDWDATKLFISRPTHHKGILSYILCDGIKVGPVTLTWPRIHALSRFKSKENE